MTWRPCASILRRPMLKFSKMPIFLLILALVAPIAIAQDEHPLRPEEAYKYVCLLYTSDAADE